ncbi:MAG: cell envelope biogenesis protein OmpA [Geminicoccaceae bacterium]|nr:MAG: cell envelope biogenesis protein OmpA [Geminicoccaceae bacterium]
MGGDDPFGLGDDERTRLIPIPGGRASGPPPAAGRRAAVQASGAPLPEGTPGRGPLVQAAHGLLLLAPRLATRTPPGDPAELRSRLEVELARYRERAIAEGADPRQVEAGHYALCALLDDVVLNTPWGAHGGWKSDSLAGTLHHDVAAGERFFALLDQAGREPARNRPLLELLAACLAVGFEGRYRLAPGGSAELARIRSELYTRLAAEAGGGERELSPSWRGAAARHVPFAERLPLWVVGVAAVGLLVLVYTLFAVQLGGVVQRLGPAVAGLPPHRPVELVRTVQATPAPPPKPAPARPLVTPLAERSRACLRAAGVGPEAVAEDLQKLRIRLPNAGLFASGRAELDAGTLPLLACLGRELAKEPSRILVVGHTDDRPIRTARFPSNWELSRARAEAVRAALLPAFADPGRLAVDGRADTEPVAPNDDEAGRARNRRVEILVLR